MTQSELDAMAEMLVTTKYGMDKADYLDASLINYFKDGFKQGYWFNQRTNTIEKQTEKDSVEDYYKAIAYRCWTRTLKVGDAYEGMNTDFDKWWKETKEIIDKGE